MLSLSSSNVTVLLLVCFTCAVRSQYGGQSETSYTLSKREVFNSSGEHEIGPSSSLFLVERSNGDSNIRVITDTKTDIQIVVSVVCFEGDEFSVRSIPPHNPDVLQISGIRNMTFQCKQSDRNETSLVNTRRINVKKDFKTTLQSGIIGVSSLVFELTDFEMNTTHVTNLTAKMNVLVVRNVSIIDEIFMITVYILEILEMMTFGTQLDFDVVSKTLKTPVPVLIGLLCQYLCMPLISYAIAKVVASDSLTAVGIFVAGVCPGGGSSNIYTYLLDGDLSLSITMTTISTLLSLAMLPFWLYTLGGEFLVKNDLDIPYIDIVVTLSVILVPLSVGLFIRNRFPSVTDRIEKIMAVVLTVLALVLITTGVISSLYLFDMFNLKIVVIGCVLPYVGFCIGAIVSLILKQPRKKIITIAIETGMQNTAIAMILLLNSFPEPLGDIATVAPISAEVMSPIPPFLISIVYLIWKACCKKYDRVGQTDKDMKIEKDKCKQDINGSDVNTKCFKENNVI